jgi:hypothetical protein
MRRRRFEVFCCVLLRLHLSDAANSLSFYQLQMSSTPLPCWLSFAPLTSSISNHFLVAFIGSFLRTLWHVDNFSSSLLNHQDGQEW